MLAAKPGRASGAFAVRSAVGAITLAGFLLRIYALGAKELRGDESFAAVFAAQPLAVIWHELGRSEPHPPLYYLLLHWTIAFGGPSSYALRYPSAFFGTLVTPALAVAAWQAFGRRAAILTALLACLNPLLVWQAQDARMYAQLAGFSAVSLAGVAAALRTGDAAVMRRRMLEYGTGDEGRGRGVMPLGAKAAAAIGVAGALLTQFYAVLFAVGLLAGLLLVAMRRDGEQRPGWRAKAATGATEVSRRLSGLAGARLLAAVVALELLVVALPVLWHGRAALVGHPTFPSLSALGLLESAGQTVAGGFTTPIPLRGPATLIAVGLALAGLGVAARIRPAMAAIFAAALVAPLGGLELLDALRPAYQPAYVAALAPAWLLLIGALAGGRGLPGLVGSGVAVVLLGAIAEQSLGVYALSQKNLSFDQAGRFLLAAGRPGDLILTNYPDPTLSWVYTQQDRGPLPMQLQPPAMPVDAAALDHTMIALGNRYDRIWFWTLRTPAWDPQHLAETWLDRHALPLVTERAGNVELRLFETPRSFQAQSAPVPDENFGGQLRVCGAAWPSGGIAPGGVLTITLCWEAVTAPLGDYTAFVHLERGATLAGQDDHPPINGLNLTDTWLPGERFLDQYHVKVASDAPPGDYALLVGFYSSATKQRLPLLDSAGSPVGDAVTLGTVQVR